MKKLNIILCGLAACSMMLTSCLKTNNEDQVVTESFGSCFSYNVNKSTGDITISKENSMIVKTNYTALNMGVTVGSLSVNGMTLPSAEFKDLKLQQNNTGWMIAEATAIRPEVKGFDEATVPMFNRVRIASLNHMTEYNGSYLPGYDRALRLDTDNEVIFVSPVSTWSTGETVVNNLSDATEPLFKSSKPIYLIKLDTEKNTASITVHNAVFAPGMENRGLVIEFRDVPFTLDGTGRVTMRRTDAFDPYYDNAPNPAFPISNLTCFWDFFTGLQIAFNCDAKGGSYRVSADLPFNFGYEADKN